MQMTGADVLKYEPMVSYVVSRMTGRLPAHIEKDELHATGMMGLVDAFEKFDPNKGANIKTYAELRVKGAILDHLRALDWVPRTLRRKGRDLEEAQSRVERDTGGAADGSAIAEAMGLSIEEYHDMTDQVAGGAPVVSFDALRGIDGEDGEPLGGDILADPNAISPEGALVASEVSNEIETAMACLTEQERTVITRYFYGDEQQNAIATSLGLTEGRVSQIRSKALKKLGGRLG